MTNIKDNMNTPTPFQKMLHEKLQERGINARKLAQKAGINHGTLSRLLSGNRDCGFEAAIKLAQALELDVYEKRRFIEYAAQRFETGNETQHHYPTIIERHMPDQLMAQDVRPDNIESVVTNKAQGGLTILVNDGRVVHVSLCIKSIQ